MTLAALTAAGCSSETCSHGEKAVESAGKDLEHGIEKTETATKEAVETIRRDTADPPRDEPATTE